MCDKPNIFLDLDNTIISSVTPKEFQKIKEHTKGLSYTVMKRFYTIFHRPYLQEFLDFIFEHFHVSVWTAGSKDYCLFIVENIILAKKNRSLKLILYDMNCDQSEALFHNESPKDLRYVFKFPNFHKNDTFILDDLPEVQRVNNKNVLPAKYFDVKHADSVNDTFLKETIEKLKKMLDKYYNTCKVEFTPQVQEIVVV